MKRDIVGCQTDIFWYLLGPSLVITQGEMRHTMFMKFQTSSQSFDQILRYEPVRTDIIHAKDDGDVSCYYPAAFIVTFSMILFPV